MVLHDDHRVACIDQVPELRRLQLGGQLEALRFPARQLGRRLGKPQLAQPGVLQQGEWPLHRRIGGEEAARLMNRHVQHVGDARAAQLQLQGRLVEPRTVAGRAWRVHARHEQQFHRHEALAFAGLAAALRRVERMRTRLDRGVTLPTDERAFGVPRCCCSDTAGGRPSIESTSGTPT